AEAFVVDEGAIGRQGVRLIVLGYHQRKINARRANTGSVVSQTPGETIRDESGKVLKERVTDAGAIRATSRRAEVPGHRAYPGLRVYLKKSLAGQPLVVHILLIQKRQDEPGPSGSLPGEGRRRQAAVDALIQLQGDGDLVQVVAARDTVGR